MNQITFPTGFIWGAATSSYQIEGAWDADGKGESIWDHFAHTPGKIEDGSSGDIACNHYHRWPEDIALMQQLGLQAYRFSISWPRILPTGRGEVNQRGLDFYSRLVDGLLEAGITPFATLYHWDLPQALQQGGGWMARSTAEAFAEYAGVVSRHLGDRVKSWITHNEPWCASFLSYQIGKHAPGLQNWTAAIQAAHHLLLSHGRAVPVIRSNSPGAEVGITLNLIPVEPASPSAADHQAARRHDGYANRWFLDPLYGREYPADMVSQYIHERHLPLAASTFVQPGDMDVIATQCDFLGVNYYHRAVLRDEQAAHNLPITNPLAPASEWTDMGWEVHPEGLYNLLNRLHFEYQPGKLYITENGASYLQPEPENGRVHDSRRIDYLRGHLLAAQRAIANGVPLAGYFAWSLLDNFEWERGYRQRFGLVWVDFDTQQRIPKDSARWYREVIARNGLLPGDGG